MFDPVSLVSAFFFGWKKANRAKAWGRLVFSMAFSGIVSYYGAAGAALIAGQPELIAKGIGMLAVAVSLLSLFTKSNLTRGMSISVPNEVVGELHAAGQAEIHRE